MDNADFDALMNETFGEQPPVADEPISTETAAPEPAAPSPDPVHAEASSTEETPAPVDAGEVSASQEPTEGTAPEPDVPEPETNPWDSDENPYRQQVIDQSQRMQAAQQLLAAIQNQQQQQKLQQVIDAIPEMDEQQQKRVVGELLMAVQQQGQQANQQMATRLQQLEEQQAKEKYLTYVSNKLSLTREERQKLGTFTDPDAGWQWAQAAVENRKQYQAQVSAATKQLEELKAAQAATARANSGVDNVGGPGTVATGTVTNPEDATDFDGFFSAWVDNPAYIRGR